MELTAGCEWIVEAHGCDPSALKHLPTIQNLFLQLITELDLNPLSEPSWHQFADSGGITGVTMLPESHIACHTFPEYRSVCLNLFCCRARESWDFHHRLQELLGADVVHVRRIERLFRQ